MPARIGRRRRDYDQCVHAGSNPGDILANAITHGVGAGLAIAGTVYLISVAARGPSRLLIACSVFSCALILVYLSSTLYHSLVRTRARKVFQILDHSAIYVLIAGTYTPFTLVSLRGSVGWVLFAVVWSLAVAGVVSKSIAMDRFAHGPMAFVSAAVYLVQGWLAIFVAPSLIHAIGWHGVSWLAAGGVAYTAGIVFYSLDRLPYFHAAWHIFVLAGSVAHYFAILFYIVPPRI
jgi:hemolysin III